MDEKITHFLDSNHIEYAENISLAKKTWIHRGPVVPFYILPSGVDELRSVVEFLYINKKDFKVIGHTSNLYFKDTFSTDAIISTRKMTAFRKKEGKLICDAGVNVTQLSKYCVERGIKGFEGLVGLPGTVAAAVVNNSSCFKCSINELLTDVDVIQYESDGICCFRTLKREELGLSHRSSAIKRKEMNAIVLQVRLSINTTTDIEDLKQKAQHNIDLRTKTQEGKALNLGSIYAGRKSRPLGIFDLGILKFPLVLTLKVVDHFCWHKESYKLKRNSYLLSLFGYKDVIPYVSPKNINCFIWKDNGADCAFVRYDTFMHECFECGEMEIEICK